MCEHSEVAEQKTQKFVPPSLVCAHLHATHAYAHDLKKQVGAHHYCSHINDDMRQCLLYDSSDKNARLIGIEYMVSEKMFQTIPDEEKPYWHSHVYEIKSGMLIVPRPEGVPEEEWEKGETEAMEGLISWYGKIYHLWQTDRGDAVPLGPPVLMTSVTSEETEDKSVLAGRDEKMGISRKRKEELRAHIPDHVIHPLADKAHEVWNKE